MKLILRITAILAAAALVSGLLYALVSLVDSEQGWENRRENGLAGGRWSETGEAGETSALAPGAEADSGLRPERGGHTRPGGGVGIVLGLFKNTLLIGIVIALSLLAGRWIGRKPARAPAAE